MKMTLTQVMACLSVAIGLGLLSNEQPYDEPQRWWINIAGALLMTVGTVVLKSNEKEEEE